MGKTIIISSHILHELAELCNAVAIVEKGQLLFNGSVAEIMRRAGSGRVVQLRVDDRTTEAAALLRQVKGISTVSITDTESGPRIDLDLDPEQGMPVSEIPSRLITQGFRVAEIHQEQVNLETAFMRLTKGIVS